MALSLITDISATCYTSQLQKIELVWICCRVSHLLPSANLLQRQRADAHFQRVIQHAIKSCRHLQHRLATRNLFSRQGRGAAVHFLFLQRHGQPRTDLRCHLLQSSLSYLLPTSPVPTTSPTTSHALSIEVQRKRVDILFQVVILKTMRE